VELTVEVIEKLEKHFDDRYVLQSECADIQEGVNSKFANDDKRIDLLINQQKINNWLTLAIAGGIISLVIKVFLGG
jgi:hypothetical protein